MLEIKIFTLNSYSYTYELTNSKITNNYLEYSLKLISQASFSNSPTLKITFNSSIFSKYCEISFEPKEITC